MNFLSIDQHISVIADVRYILNQLGHTVKELSLSGHAPVINRPSARIPMLADGAWSKVIHEQDADEFYNAYKDEFSKYDGFICCYPPIFSMLYKKWDKPIIVDIPIRYECGVECNPDLWRVFNEYLKRGVDLGKIILVANNLFDKKYTEGFLERHVTHIPSLCEYTGMSYNPTYDLFLYFAAFHIKDDTGRMILKHDALKAGHAWQTVADFRGCIHYPYNVSLMSVFEQYMACMPLFFPTKRYLLEMWLNKVGVMHQVCWPATLGKEPKTIIECPFEKDPNNYTDFNILSHWLDFADYYSGALPCIKYFDSKEERNEILSYSVEKLLSISEEMRLDNVRRRVLIYEQWDQILKRLK